jgi:hypothetical protein
MSDQELPELEPPVQARDLPAEVAALRREVVEAHRYLNTVLQPKIDGHISAYRYAIDVVIAIHRDIGDSTDIDIRAPTRWSAIWELSGRCLAICQVVMHDVEGGFTSEAVGSLRALFEATALLGAVTFHEEDDAVRRWLDGDSIRPKEARAAMGRKEQLALGRMREAGIEPTRRGPGEVGGQIYDLLSAPAHHRRNGFPETVSADLREFTYGPHPNAEVRAQYVAYAGELIETALLVVIDSSGGIIGRDAVRDALPAMQRGLERVREEYPLP